MFLILLLLLRLLFFVVAFTNLIAAGNASLDRFLGHGCQLRVFSRSATPSCRVLLLLMSCCCMLLLLFVVACYTVVVLDC